jgi:thiamine-phosphate pyrophosphorylase
MKRFPTDLYLILDPAIIPLRDIQEVAREAIEGGIRMVQYRDKQSERTIAYRIACGLLNLIRKENGILIINDDVDLALAVGADGVHLGLEDLPIERARVLLGPERIIGGSVHTFEAAVAAQEAGADYLGIGPIFPSPTKQPRAPLGCDILKEFRRRVHVPIFAIGGISLNNIESVFSNGADGAACISAILTRPDIRGTSQQMLQAIYQIRKRKIKKTST